MNDTRAIVFSDAEVEVIDSAVDQMELPCDYSGSSERLAIGILSQIFSRIRKDKVRRSNQIFAFAEQIAQLAPASNETKKWLISIYSEKLKSECSNNQWANASNTLKSITKHEIQRELDPDIIMLELNAIMIALTASAKNRKNMRKISNLLLARYTGHLVRDDITDLFAKGVCTAYVYTHTAQPNHGAGFKRRLARPLVSENVFNVAIRSSDHAGLYLRVISNAWNEFSDIRPTQHMLFKLARMNIDHTAIPDLQKTPGL